MKKIMVICLALVMGAGVCFASQNEAQPEKKTVTTVFTADIDCAHCAKKIMDNAASLGKGVKDLKVDVEKKEVTVTYDASKNSNENIVKGLASLKVNAQVKGAKACACCKHDGKTCNDACDKHAGKACGGSCDKSKSAGKTCCDKK